jgi:hypothetical protein
LDHYSDCSALQTRNLNLVIAATAELPRVGLQDALQVCLLLRNGDPDRYERGAVRWAGRFALEGRDVDLEAIERATAALNALPHQPANSMERLARFERGDMRQRVRAARADSDPDHNNPNRTSLENTGYGPARGRMLGEN